MDEFTYYYFIAANEARNNPFYFPPHGVYNPTPVLETHNGYRTPPMSEDDSDIDSDDDMLQPRTSLQQVLMPSYTYTFATKHMPPIYHLGEICKIPTKPRTPTHKMHDKYEIQFHQLIDTMYRLLWKIYPCKQTNGTPPTNVIQQHIWIGDDRFTGYSDMVYWWDIHGDNQTATLKHAPVLSVFQTPSYNIQRAWILSHTNRSFCSRNTPNQQEETILNNLIQSISHDIQKVITDGTL